MSKVVTRGGEEGGGGRGNIRGADEQGLRRGGGGKRQRARGERGGAGGDGGKGRKNDHVLTRGWSGACGMGPGGSEGLDFGVLVNVL